MHSMKPFSSPISHDFNRAFHYRHILYLFFKYFKISNIECFKQGLIILNLLKLLFM